jgi:hypothetical protein
VAVTRQPHELGSGTELTIDALLSSGHVSPWSPRG